MESKKQKLLLEYLISDTSTFTICNSIVKPDYFDPEYHRTVEFIQDYYTQYHKTPNCEQIEAETDIELTLREVTPDQIDYTTQEIEKFCKHRAMEAAILESASLINDDERDFGKINEIIKEALLVNITSDLGLNYFNDVEERLERMLNSTPVISTGWSQVDTLLFGGIARKELLLLAANSGGGKSVTLANLAVNFLKQKYNVLYISLELSEDIVAQRFDAMYTGVNRKTWKDEVDVIVSTLNDVKDQMGDLTVVQMNSSTNSSALESYLQEYYLENDFYPDLFVLDYLDKMSPNQKITDNVFEKDKAVSEQLRDLGVRYNMAVATASQLNRSAVNESNHDHSHIAGGISKINECDVFITLLKDKSMEAAGEIIFQFGKTRNSDGEGSIARMKWDAETLLITDDATYTGKSDEIQPNFKQKSKKQTKIKPASGGLDNVLDLLGDDM